MYLGAIIKQQNKSKKAKRKARNLSAFNFASSFQFPEYNKDRDSNKRNSTCFSSTRLSNANNNDAQKAENCRDNSYSNKSLKSDYKLLKAKHSKTEAKQILKVVSALLLILSANEALAWDLDAGAKAMLKPWYDLAVKWWTYFVGLAGCGLLIFSEGDLRVKSKTAAMGAALAAGVILGLIAAMGAAIT